MRPVCENVNVNVCVCACVCVCVALHQLFLLEVFKLKNNGSWASVVVLLSTQAVEGDVLTVVLGVSG